MVPSAKTSHDLKLLSESQAGTNFLGRFPRDDCWLRLRFSSADGSGELHLLSGARDRESDVDRCCDVDGPPDELAIPLFEPKRKKSAMVGVDRRQVARVDAK